MNLQRILFLSLSFLASLLTTTNKAYESDIYYLSDQEAHNIIPSCRQCNKVILGHNFCCNFNRFLQQHKRNYQQAFIDAAQHGYHEYLELLMELGADVNGYDDADGKTALMHAAQFGHLETCKLLLELGAHVDTRTNWGSTALMWAAEYGNIKICKVLIKAGAHVNAQTNRGSTAYSYAKRNRHPLICELLGNVDAIPDYQNSIFSLPYCLVTGLACYGAYQLFFSQK